MVEEKLIEAVREHKELYDTKHANYMKIKLKPRIWQDIATDINLKDIHIVLNTSNFYSYRLKCVSIRT